MVFTFCDARTRMMAIPAVSKRWLGVCQMRRAAIDLTWARTINGRRCDITDVGLGGLAGDAFFTPTRRSLSPSFDARDLCRIAPPSPLPRGFAAAATWHRPLGGSKRKNERKLTISSVCECVLFFWGRENVNRPRAATTSGRWTWRAASR